MKYLKFKEKRQFNEQVIKLVRESNIDKENKSKLIQDLQMCGSTLYFSKCMGCGTMYFNGFWACKNRFCAICSYKLHMARVAMVLEVLSALESYSLTHCVFTLRSHQNLKSMLRSMRKFLRALDNDKKIRAFRKESVLGEIRNIEVKRGLKGWHVHCHVLIVTKEKVNFFDLYFETWKRITKFEGSVFLKHVKNDINSVLEVTKYNMKIIDLNLLKQNEKLKQLCDLGFELLEDDYIAEMYYSLKNERLFSKTGIFRGVDEELFWEQGIKECKVCGLKDFEIIIEKYKDVFEFEVVDL